MDITWLASYPKSGNTYLRFLLFNYIFGNPNTSIEVESEILDLVTHLAKSPNLEQIPGKTWLIKTHSPYSQNHPFVNRTKSFIYLIRNPRDVIHSSMRYFLGENAPIEEQRSYVQEFIDNYGAYAMSGFGRWNQNVASWLNCVNQKPGLFVRYEDLKAEPEKKLAQIIEFLGFDVDSQKIKVAVQNSSLDSMKKMEDQEIQAGIAHLGTFRKNPECKRFVGQAASGQSLEMFGEDIEKEYQRKFGFILDLFGYDTK